MYPLNAVVLRVAREIWRTTPTCTSHQLRFHEIGEDPISCVIKRTATSGSVYHARWEIIAAGGNHVSPRAIVLPVKAGIQSFLAKGQTTITVNTPRLDCVFGVSLSPSFRRFT